MTSWWYGKAGYLPKNWPKFSCDRFSSNTVRSGSDMAARRSRSASTCAFVHTCAGPRAVVRGWVAGCVGAAHCAAGWGRPCLGCSDDGPVIWRHVDGARRLRP
eukprot:6516262-Prymnesium_polylepis.1